MLFQWIGVEICWRRIYVGTSFIFSPDGAEDSDFPSRTRPTTRWRRPHWTSRRQRTLNFQLSRFLSLRRICVPMLIVKLCQETNIIIILEILFLKLCHFFPGDGFRSVLRSLFRWCDHRGRNPLHIPRQSSRVRRSQGSTSWSNFITNLNVEKNSV